VIHLHVSDRFELLAGVLAERVRACREAAGAWAFEPVEVVAPNGSVRLAVQLELARRLGISANLRFLSAEELALRRLPHGERDRTRALGRAELQRLLLDLLASPLLAEPVLAPVARYLRHGDGAPADGLDADAVDRRRVQLSGRLAARFEGYWTEAWQRRLWLAVEARLDAGPRDDDALLWRTLPDLLRRGDGEEPIAELHVVGFTHLEPLHVEALARRGRRADVRVYAVAPRPPVAVGDGPGVERWGRRATSSSCGAPPPRNKASRARSTRASTTPRRRPCSGGCRPAREPAPSTGAW
jgi:exonuclease V gamma subunit